MTSDHEPLHGRIERIMAGHKQIFAQRAEARGTDMTAIDEFRQRFERVYETWRSEIIDPKFAVVVAQWPPESARMVKGTYDTTLKLRPGAEFVVGATVVLKACPDPAGQNVRMSFEVSILPILMEYDRGAEFAATLDDQGRTGLAAFLDDRLSIFVSDYCRIHAPDSPYQRDATVIDPVCGMSFLRSEAKASIQLGGGTVHFCSEACREHFEKEKKESV